MLLSQTHQGICMFDFEHLSKIKDTSSLIVMKCAFLKCALQAKGATTATAGYPDGYMIYQL